MMGWRVGYLAAPPRLQGALRKVQDTIPICPAPYAQAAALGALEAGRSWVEERVSGLAANKRVVADALAVVAGPEAVRGGSGAIYLMGPLPEAAAGDDLDAVVRLSKDHGVQVIPGSACGAPGMIRACYANLDERGTVEAAAKLKRGLVALASGAA